MNMNQIPTTLLTLLAISFSGIAEAQMQQQDCLPNATRTAPDSRFKDIGNGEVEDLETGLVWQRCRIGQSWDGASCTGTPKEVTWLEALNDSKALGNGYRLPNFKEIASLTERACKPSLNTTYFDASDNTAHYWTSTPHNTDDTQVLVYNLTGASGINQQFMMATKDSIYQGYYKVYALPVRNK